MDLSRPVPVTTLGEAYGRVGKLCETDEELLPNRYKIEESEGYVVMQSAKGAKRLPRLSQYPPVSRGDVVRETILFPRAKNVPDQELPRGEQVVVTGGARHLAFGTGMRKVWNR